MLGEGRNAFSDEGKCLGEEMRDEGLQIRERRDRIFEKSRGTEAAILEERMDGKVRKVEGKEGTTVGREEGTKEHK